MRTMSRRIVFRDLGWLAAAGSVAPPLWSGNNHLLLPGTATLPRQPRTIRVVPALRNGLLQGGNWDEPEYIAASPWFRGYVVFLQIPSAPK